MNPIQTATLLRSALYVPGSNPRTLAKAPTLGADALILDLEDSVAPEAKESARQNVLATLESTATPGGPLRIVRINGVRTPWWQEDLTTLLPGRPDAFALSKTESVEELAAPAALLSRLEGDTAPPRPLWAMIESPLGVLNAFAIAAHPRVDCLVMGTSDLARALGLQPDPERLGLRLALQQTILAARAAGVRVIDGVFVDIRDDAGFLAECRAGARLGFDGKSLIHPAQVEPANRTFRPSEEEARRAQRLLEAWNAARAQGEEICVVEGRLVERLHAEQARRLLALHEMAEKRE